MVLDTEAFKELKRLTKSQGNFGQSNQRKKRAERRQNFEPNFDDYNYSDYSDSDYEAGGSSRRRQRGTGQVKRPKKQLQATHAITTKLVSHFFGSVFGTEIKDVRKTGCGVCKSCKKVDCSKCANCKMKKKFGGYRDDDTVVCYQRECDEKVIKIDDDDEPMNFVRKREKSTKIGNVHFFIQKNIKNSSKLVYIQNLLYFDTIFFRKVKNSKISLSFKVNFPL